MAFARSGEEFFEAQLMMSHPLLPKLRQLKLSGILNTLDVRVSQAVDQQLAPLEFLALLLDDELERRNQNRLVLKLVSLRMRQQQNPGSFRLLGCSWDQSHPDPGPGLLCLYPAP